MKKARELAKAAKPKIKKAALATGKWVTNHIGEPFFRGLGQALGGGADTQLVPDPPDHVLQELRSIRSRVLRSRSRKIDLRHFMVERSEAWNYYVAVNGRPGYGTSKKVVLRRLNAAINRLLSPASQS